MAQKTLANQASKALFSVKSKLTQFGDLNLSELFKIFEIKILPILLYGSEIWFSHTSIDMERVHNQFSRGYDSVIRRMKSCVCVGIDSVCLFVIKSR